MRFVKPILLIVIGLVLLFAYMRWSEDYYIKSIAPTGIVTVSDYLHRFGQPTSCGVVELNGVPYFRFGGRIPEVPAYVFPPMPSSSPAYLFDESGHYVDWCADPGEINYPWPKGGVGSSKISELKSFEKNFGVEPTSNPSTTHQ